MRKKFVEDLHWIEEQEMMDLTAIISVISLFYQAFRDNTIVNMAMTGMLAGAAAVICDVVITMGTGIFRQKRFLPIAVLLVSFLAVRFLGVNIILIILLCGVIGAVDTLCQRKMKGNGKNDLS